jgi:F0F1-type ATP synthase membrane subunit c/vacuolar-type H+-ATPase subunit K
MGIPLKASQLGDSAAAKAVDSVTKNTPFSGGRAFQDTQSQAFNRAVSRTIGEDSPKITPQVFDRARQRIGAEFDRLTESTNLPLTPQLAGRIQAVIANAKPFGAEATNTINGIVKDLVSRSEGGVLSGRAYQSIDSNLGKAIAAGGERSVYLGDLQEALRDAVAKNLSPDDAAAWANARAQYRDLKTIEPLVAKAGQTSGNISPGGLMERVTANRAGKASMARGDRGDLGDLAAIGQRFVKDPVGNSGTAPRVAVMEALKSAAPTIGLAGGLTGLGNLYGIGNAALGGLSAVATSRLAQKVFQNPELVGAMLGNGKGLSALSQGVQTSTQPTALSLLGGLRNQ